eukprot:COSAG04_NODE_1956_length_5141_cov_4.223126_4_plen_500_part_00
MNPIAAPSTLRYEPDAGLPVAIEARSNRRTFFPSNGTTFSRNGTNIIRLNLNSQSFIDFSHSYLQFTLDNRATNASLAVDEGCPFFSRVQIMSGGKELEDIQEYGRLYSILQAVQGSGLNKDEQSLTSHISYGAPSDSAATVDATTMLGDHQVGGLAHDGMTTTLRDGIKATMELAINNAINAQFNQGEFKYNKANQIAAAGGANDFESRTYNLPIVSAIFNIQKYFPLLLTDQGLDIYLHLETSKNIGAWSHDPNTDYQISNVKYIAHEVNLDDSFVNQMKASMAATGGVLSLSSTTYRYNQVTEAAASGSGGDLNLSVRTKSLKGLIVRPQAQALNEDHRTFAVSVGQHCGINSIQFRVGSVLYPQSAIEFSDTNKGELFNEIRKCFGTIGVYNYGTSLNTATVRVTTANEMKPAEDAAPKPEGVKSTWLAAYDFETFAKSATESGLNTADRALAVTMDVKRTGIDANEANGVRYDTFAMCDCIIYISQNGEIFTRI